MIYIECKADEALLISLGIQNNEYQHTHGKPEICNKLPTQQSSKGLMDEDPKASSHPYLKKLKSKMI